MIVIVIVIVIVIGGSWGTLSELALAKSARRGTCRLPARLDRSRLRGQTGPSGTHGRLPRRLRGV
ncbi:hypothetical protein [Nocardia sp. NBC_01329]|uniref:hypothetical protein n=1 Tax=Nocardia sp. NBC_01329 TaxID=2903594 RepID=UPI002E0D3FBF|nr:hypothetical protein OG405_19215 [Nocardia sp. NBC_01329]